MSENVLTSIKSRFRLFKQPHKIGGITEVNGTPLLIIGIENFELWGGELTVWYTCQRLDVTDYISMQKAYDKPHTVEMEVCMRHDDERWKCLKLGRIYQSSGNVYKAMEWTEIKLKGTDLYVSLSARQIHPIDRKEAKAKLFSERRKKLKLEVL